MLTRRLAPIVLSLIAAIALSACSDKNQELTPAHVVITDAWAKEAEAGGRSAAYITIVNEGTEPDRLMAAYADGVQMAEVHNHLHDGDVVKMISVPSLEIPSAGTLTFKPGGLHIMLMGLEKPLKAGDSLHLTLSFQKTGVVTVDAKVLTMDEVLEQAQ